MRNIHNESPTSETPRPRRDIKDLNNLTRVMTESIGKKKTVILWLFMGGTLTRISSPCRVFELRARRPMLRRSCDCWPVCRRRRRPETRDSAVWRPQRPRPPNGTWTTRDAAAVAAAGGAPPAADGGDGAGQPRPPLPPLRRQPYFEDLGARDVVAVDVGRTCRPCRPDPNRPAHRRRAPRRAAPRRCRPQRPQLHRLPRPCTVAVAAVVVGVCPVHRTGKPKRNAHVHHERFNRLR